MPHRLPRVSKWQDRPEEENEAVHHQQPGQHFFQGEPGQGQKDEGQGQPDEGHRIGFRHGNQDGEERGHYDFPPGVQTVCQGDAFGKGFRYGTQESAFLLLWKYAHKPKKPTI